MGADQTYDSTNSLYLLAGGNINAAGRTVANTSYGGIMLVAGWDRLPGLARALRRIAAAGSGAINASGATFSTVGGNITIQARDNITVGSLITTGYRWWRGQSAAAMPATLPYMP